jgi:hypothetical protein
VPTGQGVARVGELRAQLREQARWGSSAGELYIRLVVGELGPTGELRVELRRWRA